MASEAPSQTGAPSEAQFRIEHDTMGEVRVPAAAKYRAQTQRAVENFPISGTPLERAHIEALARIKKAAALANAELGVLDATWPRPSPTPPRRWRPAAGTASSPSTSSRPGRARART